MEAETVNKPNKIKRCEHEWTTIDAKGHPLEVCAHCFILKAHHDSLTDSGQFRQPKFDDDDK